MTLRRRLTCSAAVAAASLVLGACGTFTDNDVVARVGDAELTEADLREIFDGAEVVATQTADRQVWGFILNELIAADLESLDVDVELPDTSDMAPGEAIEAEFQARAAAWTTLDTAMLLDEATRRLYLEGGEASGVVCPAHILVPTAEAADTVMAELASGADFGELAAEMSIDASAANRGALDCIPHDQVDQAYVPEFAAGVQSAEIGIPAEPVESAFGFHVIRLVPVDELPAIAAIRLRVHGFDDRFDIFVDPRYGEWSPDGDVVPVG